MPTKLFDVNRIKKTYPLLKLKPIYNQISSETGIQAETAILDYINSFSESYTFTKLYEQIPTITATAEDENVNVFITNLDLLTVTIQSSSPFTGKVHVHVFKSES